MLFFLPKPPNLTGFWPKKHHQKKNAQKGQKRTKTARKWGQNDAKMTPNDAKTMPKWSVSDPKMAQK